MDSDALVMLRHSAWKSFEILRNPWKCYVSKREWTLMHWSCSDTLPRNHSKSMEILRNPWKCETSKHRFSQSSSRRSERSAAEAVACKLPYTPLMRIRVRGVEGVEEVGSKIRSNTKMCKKCNIRFSSFVLVKVRPESRNLQLPSPTAR